MPKIIGLVVVRNHKTLDYIPELAAESLVPFCDEVVVSDMQSDDGSYEALQEWVKNHDKIRLVQQAWEKPHNDPQWWVKALNVAREEIAKREPNAFLFQLDADELVGPECAHGVKMCVEAGGSAFFKRFNFWKDTKHLVPENRCCGEYVARLGPVGLYLPSDEPEPAVKPNIRTLAEYYPNLFIYHYGFLRDSQAFIKKSEVVQNAFFGSCDQRLLDAKGRSERWYDVRDYFDGLELRDWFGTHPSLAHQWLAERGYKV